METYDLRRRARLADSRCVATFAGLSRALRCARRVRSVLRKVNGCAARPGLSQSRAVPCHSAALAGRISRPPPQIAVLSVHQPPRAVEPTRYRAPPNQGERLTRVAVAVDAWFDESPQNGRCVVKRRNRGRNGSPRAPGFSGWGSRATLGHICNGAPDLGDVSSGGRRLPESDRVSRPCIGRGTHR